MRMNKRIWTGLALMVVFSLRAQENIKDILSEVEKNNQFLRAYASRLEVQRLNDRVENNLPDPEFEVEQLFSSTTKMGRESEMILSQEFEFPSVYAMRSRLNREKSESYEQQWAIARMDVLLKAKEICCDLVCLNRQRDWLEKRLKNADLLTKYCQSSMQEGNASLLDYNKLKLEMMNVRTEFMKNESQRKAKLKELQTLNGGIELDFTLRMYDEEDQTASMDELVSRDWRVRLAEKEQLVANRHISLARSKWLPNLSLGYKYSNGDSEQFNGFVAGLSIPLFANSKQVKVAKAESVTSSIESMHTRISVENELSDCWEQIELYKKELLDYRQVLGDDQTLDLLDKALQSGEISMLEYLVSTFQVYQMMETYLSLENEYHKLLARLYKSSL